MKARMSKWCAWIAETDPVKLAQTYREWLKKAGFNILSEVSYHFYPQGFTQLYLLAESHFAIHTFPEEHKTYVELSSCNEKMYDKFLA